MNSLRAMVQIGENLDALPMKSGYYDLLMKRINDYFKARTNKAKHQLVLSSDELPLTDTSSSHLHTKIKWLFVQQSSMQ